VLGGGKRIRPTFAWWGWRGAGGDPDGPAVDAVLRAVSALELIQACALVHDDLMDASATRRGRPTVHVAFARRHAEAAWRGRPARFGAAAAILLGDLALVWADDMLRGAGLDADAAARAAAPWEAMRTEVLGGQYLDVFVQSTGDSSARAALQIDRYKTAAYTVERPLHLGAAIAGADPDLVTCYRRFGADIGVAFQLRDDLLGVFGAPAVTGKPAGDALREGKRTPCSPWPSSGQPIAARRPRWRRSSRPSATRSSTTPAWTGSATCSTSWVPSRPSSSASPR
jgi:geranylgeranyl diphosphate synthase type I